MVGRSDQSHAKDKNYMYVFGTDASPNMQKCLETSLEHQDDMHIDYTKNNSSKSRTLFWNSDHRAYGKDGIPIAFFISGLHDDYHKPTDTVDKIEFEAMQNRVMLLAEYIYQLSECKEKFVREFF